MRWTPGTEEEDSEDCGGGALGRYLNTTAVDRGGRLSGAALVLLEEDMNEHGIQRR